MTPSNTLAARLDIRIDRAAKHFDRLVGISLLRIFLGVAAVVFYASDYSEREYLWGPRSYYLPAEASARTPPGLFSLYLLSDSDVWFSVVFHVGFGTAALFTVFGGRVLTALHAVLLWSIYMRNPDVINGGDNLTRILLVFMVFTVSNAYFAPRARRRRAKLRATRANRPQSALVHNFAVTGILVQIALVYFVSGFAKATASIWTNGTAMYYVSRINQFSMFPWYPQAMSNVYLAWAVAYFTIIVEVAVPFVIWSKRAKLRKLVVLSLEGMHIGIMLLMGLVAFGLQMIGADSALLTDQDYRSLARGVRSARFRRRPGATGRPSALGEAARAGAASPA